MALPVVILCGGKGTRLKSLTEEVPKSLIEVGPRPILWHLLQLYAHHGHREFILCLGYKGDAIKRYFMDSHAWESEDFSLQIAAGERRVRLHRRKPASGWALHFADTGAETNTGGRIRRIRHLVKGKTFLATYGDGLSNVDLPRLIRFHKAHGRIATLTAVRPPSQFGILELGEGDRVKAFHEKPRMTAWVNGGFFVFEREIFDLLGEDDVLERAPFERLAKDGQIVAYRHEGFWECMDTYQDNLRLNGLWAEGKAAWKVWE